MADLDHNTYITACDATLGSSDVGLTNAINNHIRSNLGLPPSASCVTGPAPQIAGTGWVTGIPPVNPQIPAISHHDHSIFGMTSAAMHAAQTREDQELRERCLTKALAMSQNLNGLDDWVMRATFERADAMFRYIKTGNTNPS